MEYKLITELLQELQDLTGTKWIVRSTEKANNDTMTYGHYASCFPDGLGVFGKDEFKNFPEAVRLNLEDFKKWLEDNYSGFQNAQLVQEFDVVELKNDKEENVCRVSRLFSFEKKLKDQSMIVDNLTSFNWAYCWRKSPFAYLDITAIPNSEIIALIDDPKCLNLDENMIEVHDQKKVRKSKSIIAFSEKKSKVEKLVLSALSNVARRWKNNPQINNKFIRLIDERDEKIEEHFEDESMAEMLNYPKERDWYNKNILSLDREIVKEANRVLKDEVNSKRTVKYIDEVYHESPELNAYYEEQKEKCSKENNSRTK